MDYEGFISIVEQRAHIDRPVAERATWATLRTLAERLSDGEARELAAQLPPELVEPLSTRDGPQPFDVDEFLRRVAGREGGGQDDIDELDEVDEVIAERHARAVFAALRRAVSADELADVEAELPHDFRPLLESLAVLPAATFLARVASRAGLDVDRARRATDAVLETLAQRVPPGEVDDLISRLPVPLHAALRRGKVHGNGQTRPMAVGDFVRLVAEREGTTPEQALAHGRAVFATLREALKHDEFLDVTVQFPREYDVLVRI